MQLSEKLINSILKDKQLSLSKEIYSLKQEILKCYSIIDSLEKKLTGLKIHILLNERSKKSSVAG